jgi:hypothetical protein
MRIPGVTTTRLHLVLAALCALSGTVTGLATAMLFLLVLAARGMAIRHQAAAGMARAAVGTQMVTMPPLNARRQTA